LKEPFDSATERGYTVSAMRRRLASILLVLTVALTGLTVCPRGGWSCMMMRQPSPDCCGQRIALRAGDCCCGPATHMVSPALGTADQHDHLPATSLLNAPILLTAVCGAAPPPSVHPHRLPLPDTLFTQHTALLL